MKRTFSLRTKFTLALLATSLLSLLAAGLIARAILFHEFSDIAMQKAFQRFHEEMTDYIGTYGSWEKAVEVETFPAFESRQRNLTNQQRNNFRQPLNADAANDTSARPGSPPFRFVITDPKGKILMGGNHYNIGKQAPASLLARAKPILVNGKTAALALPDSKPNFNDLDRGYLEAIRQALIAAGITGVLLALALGLLIGTRLNRALKSLNNAITAMQSGDLHQSVKVNSSDEIGELANSFNRMSAELARTHDELKQSHSQISAQAQQLKELSIRDSLTGLYNRRHFDEQAATLFAEATRYCQPLTVVIGDIDYFKKINDNFSHATGDQVLRIISQLLQNQLRDADVLARYGGEEFALILPQTPLLVAVDLCEKLRLQIENHPWHEIDPDLRVTMSFGLSDDTSQGDFEKQLAIADDKLHLAKMSGRNCVSFDTPQQDETEGAKVLL